MTYGPAVRYDQPTAANRNQQLEDIACIWAVMVVMDDLPSTAERKAALREANRDLRARMEEAGITEAVLCQHVEQMGRQKPRLRLVPDDY